MSFDTRAARERADAATEGPWVIDVPTLMVGCEETVDQATATSLPDAIFIAHARTDVVALCDEVDSLRAENHDLLGQLSARDAADFADDEIAQNTDGRYRTAVRDEVDRLRAALAFYADENQYWHHADAEIFADQGQRARVALGEQT